MVNSRGMETMEAQYNTVMCKIMEWYTGEDQSGKKEADYVLVQRWNQRYQT